MWLPSSQGTAYYVRVSAYNMKGWGPPQASMPSSAIPSSKYHWECPQEPAPAVGWIGGRLGWGLVDLGAEAAFGVSGQAGRLWLGIWSAASS